MIDFETIELDPDAARQYIDARAAFIAWEEATAAARQVRGGMVWVKAKGAEYLARTTAAGAQTGLGRRSAETEKLYADFHARKLRLVGRVASLREQLAVHVRKNKALRVGRMPLTPVRILSRLATAGLSPYLRTVGTHALYAYEAAAGVRLPSETTATLDIDLLYDARRRMQFEVALSQHATSMIELLQKVDRTFEINDGQRYTATNDKGFQVDFLRRERVEGDPHPIKLSDAEDDLYVVQAPRAGVLANAPSFSEVVVAANGEMARMDTVDPRVFSSFKRWMAQQPERDPIKRRRDLLQAEAVEQMVAERLQFLLEDANVRPSTAHRGDRGS